MTSVLDTFPKLQDDMNKVENSIVKEYLPVQVQFLQEYVLFHEERRSLLMSEFSELKEKLYSFKDLLSKSKKTQEMTHVAKMKNLGLLDSLKLKHKEYMGKYDFLLREIAKQDSTLKQLKNDINNLTTDIKLQELKDLNEVEFFEQLLEFKIKVVSSGKETNSKNIQLLFDNGNSISVDLQNNLIVDIQTNKNTTGMINNIKNKDQLQILLTNNGYKKFIVEARKSFQSI